MMGQILVVTLTDQTSIGRCVDSTMGWRCKSDVNAGPLFLSAEEEIGFIGFDANLSDIHPICLGALLFIGNSRNQHHTGTQWVRGGWCSSCVFVCN